MVLLNTDDVLFTGIVTIIACVQLSTFMKRVGKMRYKHNVSPPETKGPPEFQRVFRAQQNCMEFFPMYLASLWISSMFFHQVPSAIMGLVYIYARANYFNGYVKNADDRLPGFKLSINCLMAGLAMCVVGLSQSVLHKYFGVDLRHMSGIDRMMKL